MVSPLEGKMAQAIGKGFANVFYDATLVRTTPGVVDPENPEVKVNASTEEFPCKAMVDDYTDFQKANAGIKAGDRKILILTTSLSVTPNTSKDRITIRGESYKVVSFKTDPAEALWEIQAHK